MTQIRLRLVFGPHAMLGPGKAELLAQIAASGSIAAAGRAMGMSYKRAWSLVEEMNHAFCAPLVISSRGGAAGGGATLTDTGAQVLAHYRALTSRLGVAAVDVTRPMPFLDAEPLRVREIFAELFRSLRSGGDKEKPTKS